MKRTRRKTRTGTRAVGIGILALVLVYAIVSMVIVKVVYDGRFPRFERPDETVTAALRYSDLKAEYPRRLVTFESGPHRLQGYVYGMDQDQGLVVVAHGLGGGADSYLAQITFFVDQGWRVFAYDATGSFDSEGASTIGFPQSLVDLDAALAYIGEQQAFQGLPILLFGHSWGGYAVANILHYDHVVAGVVTASAPNSATEMIVEQARGMMGWFADLQRPFLALYQRFLFGETASLAVLDAINRSTVPVFVIHGQADEMFSYSGSAIIARAKEFTNPNVHTLVVTEPGRSGHTDLFRSSAAVSYLAELNVVYRELFERYDRNIPYEVRQDFYAGVDRTLAQELDQRLMDAIHSFFLACLES